MRVGIAANHGAFEMKGDLLTRIRSLGHSVIDFGADELNAEDDYPDFVIPLADAVATGWADRGVVLCGSGVGASICANKILGARAALIHDHFSARQGVEDDHMNIMCIGGRAAGVEVAWHLVSTFLDSQYSQADRHLRRICKVATLEEWHTAPNHRSRHHGGRATG
jgi:ribose 5-phosphate isomerase B